jgi:hypothetical protein
MGLEDHHGAAPRPAGKAIGVPTPLRRDSAPGRPCRPGNARSLLLLLLLAACSKSAPPTPAAPAPPPASAPSGPPHVDQGLLGELSHEAATRPGAKPSVEDVLTALEGDGIAIERQQQVLATPIGARYCVAAVSKLGLNMSICEFATAEAAKAGRERSLKVFKSIQNRTLVLADRTMLTLIVGRPDPAIVAQREMAEKRMKALAPR